MILGRVVGSVWGGKEVEALGGRKLLQVQPVCFLPGADEMVVDADRPVPMREGLVVAVDMLGAGIGEIVLVAHGSRVRDLTVGPDVPTKEVVIAIVDSCQVDPSLFPDWQGK